MYKRAFIQIPILIGIIATAIAATGIGYFTIKQNQEKSKLRQEITTLRNKIEEQIITSPQNSPIETIAPPKVENKIPPTHKPTPQPTQTPSPTPTPIPLPNPSPSPTPNFNKEYALNNIYTLLQQRAVEINQQKQSQTQLASQLNSILQQINQIKLDYYAEVESINNDSWLTESVRRARIAHAAEDANYEIEKLKTQYDILMVQYGAISLNYQVSQNITIPNDYTVWRIEGSLDGLSGTMYNNQGQTYRWDCVDYSNCTLY
ncbi:MAG: hypothetical protein UX65_C0002G0014 [Parcubacteria group bacterium GW2011_GWB1_46_8]|nr:MAG: hypothetical protein UX14_C0004G0005 [Parcubacteria group bacterium GW2011_GWF1_45_5]KKU11381.1 MAG: hypothetical protein UX15_C0007G0006 [Parcubacteria group bacterium GW2011_GWA1_45_7]KKU46540.1 MAG: hypothetical protein UX65_C0002G0014 [Parcubacteria group bacterium GW2011_GWB1_46_8]KKU47985.1 MAG: hypothetical protein UX66_C0001G0004 [Parcubacteria group bacterium GW2011_GWF2_46_8]